MAKHRRSYRVGERVQAIIAQELLQMGDPRFHLVTIISATMSPDLRNAKIYWMVHESDAERRKEVEEAFESAQRHFKHLLAQELHTRVIPNLKFFYDDTMDYVERMNDIFASIKSSTPQE